MSRLCVLSFGKDCQTRHHLQRFCREKTGADLTTTYFFDWTWRRSGLASVCQWLDNQLEINRSDFDIEKIAHKYEVVNLRYGVFFTHDFHLESLDAPAARRCLELEFPRFKEKYTFLAARTQEHLTEATEIVALIRDNAKQEELASLKAFLDLCSPHGEHRIVHLYDPEAGPIEATLQSVLQLPVKNQTWPGDSVSWDIALEKLNIEFAKLR